MKKYKFILGVIVVFISLSQMSYAQIKVGAKVGSSLGKLSDGSNNIYSQNSTSKGGVDYGILVEIPVSKRFSIQPEVLFTNRGGRRNGVQPVDTGSLADALAASGITINMLNQLIVASGGTAISDANPLYANFRSESDLNYLEIPVLAKLDWGNRWHFYVNSGPYFGFLFNADQKTRGVSTFYLDGQGTQPLQVPNPLFDPNNPDGQPPFVGLPPQSFDAKTGVKDGLKTFAFGIHTGFGIIRKLNERQEIFFDVRGSYSFIPIQKDKTFGSSKVGGIVFSLGYTFAL